MKTQPFGSQVIGCLLAAVFIAAAGPQPSDASPQPDTAAPPPPVPVWAMDGTHNRVALASR